ncbi:hypothetical protein Ndes2526B_g00727 [Nannochloris sp. 'desiccata']
MSAILPRSQKSTSFKLSHSSKEANKGKKSFQGTGDVQKTGRKQEVQTIQSHPWSGFVEKLLSPLPPDIRYNIQRALGGVAEAVGRMFPNQNTENQVRGGRRGF